MTQLGTFAEYAVLAEESVIKIDDWVSTPCRAPARPVLTPSVLPAELLAPAMMLTRKGGTCLMTAIPKIDVNIVPLLLVDFIQSCKTLKGLLYGGMNPRASMPMLLSMYRDGHLKLDELVTRRYRLEQINDAIRDMREGRNIRGIIEFD